MIEKIGIEKLYKSKQGDVDSIFHFSFADYYDANNIHYGSLRVMNDDIIYPDVGFPMHAHANMEIVSFCVDGQLTHGDSMGNEETLYRGDVQYMSAGTGILHSEYNRGKENGRFLQIWILPDQKNHKPNYGSKRFEKSERENKLLQIVSSKSGNGPIKINQEAEIFVSESDKDIEIPFDIANEEKVYFKLIEGHVEINGVSLNEKEAAKIENENKILIKTKTKALFMIIKLIGDLL